MNPIDYPFYYDGTSYMGILANAFLESNFWAGSRELWHQQAPLFFIFELAACRISGFSYQTVLFAQSVLVGLLFGGNFWLSIRAMLHQGLRVPVAAGIRFFLILLSIFASFGVLHVMPGNIFDFRMDISGSLLLVAALQSLIFCNWLTALLVAIAICERFHNLGILGVTTVVWITSSFLFDAMRVGVDAALRASVRRGWPPLLGFSLLLLLRGPQMMGLLQYYIVGHFTGTEKALRGFGGWGSPGYFSYYPEAVLSEYLFVPSFAAFVVFALWLARQNRTARDTGPATSSARPLLIGAVSAFSLLIIDPTRNNIGVLRYVIAPLVFWLAAEIFFASEKAASSWSKSIVPFLICLLSVCGASSRLLRFYKEFDYFGIRARPILLQIEPIFASFYTIASEKKSHAIKVAANFNTDLNLNSSQWSIYQAMHGLPKVGYNFAVGSLFQVDDFQKQVLGELTELDFFIDGNAECRSAISTPFNRQVSDRIDAFSGAISKLDCVQSIGVLVFGGCVVSIKKCGGKV